MRRRDLLALAGALVVLPLQARAQAVFTKRVGFMSSMAAGEPSQPYLDGFWAGVGKYGWSDKNLLVDYRWDLNTADVAVTAARELVALGPDLIFERAGSPGLTAVAGATQTIPIVFAAVNVATAAGLVSSFAHPSGNITGFTNTPDVQVYEKELSLLKETAPDIKGIATLFNPDAVPGGQMTFLNTLAPFVAQKNLALTPYAVRSLEDISDAIRQIGADPTVALLIEGDGYVTSNRTTVIAELMKYRVVALSNAAQEFARDGGLMAYAPDPAPLYRSAGEYAGLILGGTKVADLPIQSSSPQLLVNLKTAKATGITIPYGVLAQADLVIQ